MNDNEIGMIVFEDEARTKAQPWFKRAIGIKVNKHELTSFRQGLSRNPGFQTLIIVDSG
jgi:hypothetical protein